MPFPFLRIAPFLALLFLFSCKNGNSSQSDSSSQDSIFQQPQIKSYTQAIADNPDKANLYYDRGMALHTIFEDSLALKDFTKAIQLDSSKAEYYSAVGDLLFEHKDITGSVSWLKKAAELDPNDKRVHLKIAKMFLFSREFQSAFDEINQVLRTDAFNPEGYYLKGLVYREMADTNKAISSLQTSVNVAPDYRDAHLQLGLLYSAKKNPLALQYLTNAYELDTTSVLPIYARGLFYQEQGKYEQAKAEYTKCLLGEKNFSDAYFATGFILMQQDSLEKARRQFDYVTKIELQNPKAYYNRGLCNELMDNKEAAKEDYQTALQFNPDYKPAKEALLRVK